MCEYTCTTHPESSGKWWCPVCRHALCDQCIREVFLDGKWEKHCGECEGECVSIRALTRREPMGFLPELPGAFVYPFTGSGWAVIAATSLCYSVLGSLLSFGSISGMFVTALILAVAVLVTLYVFALMLEIVSRSTVGDDTPPSHPNITDIVGDAVRPMFLAFGTFVIGFLPSSICLIAFYSGAAAARSLLYVTIPLGILYVPMGLLSMTMFDSSDGLNPVLVIRSAIRVGGAYIVACAVLLGAMGLHFVLRWYVVGHVPYIGPLVNNALTVYSLMVAARILGLIYFNYEHRLDWFPRGRE